MSEIFVAGDIHGNYQGLMESLNAAGWQEGDTIICVGDVTDRGKDNARTVSFLQEHECNVRLVQGNHELQHRKMLQYYHVLIKVPQIRLFAAGIFRTYKEGYPMMPKELYTSISPVQGNKEQRLNGFGIRRLLRLISIIRNHISISI